MELTINEQANTLFKSILKEYDVIANYHFDQIKERSYLGERLKSCRFCKNSFPKVSFRFDAHALPQFIGNKFLISLYECDSCNKLFSETMENEMANAMKLLHNSNGVKGGSGIPVYKKNGVRMESNSSEYFINGIDASLCPNDANFKEMVLDLTSDKFTPIAFFKCLVKMALSILPESEVAYFDKACQWITEKNQEESEFTLKNLHVIYSQILIDDSFSDISAIILKRNLNSFNPQPSFIFRLTYSKFSFQINLPLCSLDENIILPEYSLNYIPHLIDFAYGLDSSEKIYFDFSSKEKTELPIQHIVKNLDYIK